MVTGDLVDRVFVFLSSNPRMPKMAAETVLEVKQDIRRQFAGDVVGNALSQAVLRLFDGTNAVTVARSLNISRATVYRHLKQARDERKAAAVLFKIPAEDRLTFSEADKAGPAV